MVSPISIQEIMEMYEYRKLLECFAAELTARIIGSEDIVFLKNTP